MKKKLVLVVLMVMVALALVGCTEADKVSTNISKEADNFNVIRRLSVINARTDKPLFELVGAFSIKTDAQDSQLEVTCQTGPNEYKKHFVYLNSWTIYVVEDLSGANVSPYKYEINYLPESIIPITFTSSY